jgi:hypothetical protein
MAGGAAADEAIAGDAAGLEAGLAAATALDAGELEASAVGFAAVDGDDAGADEEHARLSNKHETTITIDGRRRRSTARTPEPRLSPR